MDEVLDSEKSVLYLTSLGGGQAKQQCLAHHSQTQTKEVNEMATQQKTATGMAHIYTQETTRGNTQYRCSACKTLTKQDALVCKTCGATFTVSPDSTTTKHAAMQAASRVRAKQEQVPEQLHHIERKPQAHMARVAQDTPVPNVQAVNPWDSQAPVMTGTGFTPVQVTDKEPAHVTRAKTRQAATQAVAPMVLPGVPIGTNLTYTVAPNGIVSIHFNPNVDLGLTTTGKSHKVFAMTERSAKLDVNGQEISVYGLNGYKK